jgi:hypothetical protein
MEMDYNFDTMSGTAVVRVGTALRIEIGLSRQGCRQCPGEGRAVKRAAFAVQPSTAERIYQSRVECERRRASLR